MVMSLKLNSFLNTSIVLYLWLINGVIFVVFAVPEVVVEVNVNVCLYTLRPQPPPPPQEPQTQREKKNIYDNNNNKE